MTRLSKDCRWRARVAIPMRCGWSLSSLLASCDATTSAGGDAAAGRGSASHVPRTGGRAFCTRRRAVWPVQRVAETGYAPAQAEMSCFVPASRGIERVCGSWGVVMPGARVAQWTVQWDTSCTGRLPSWEKFWLSTSTARLLLASETGSAMSGEGALRLVGSCATLYGSFWSC
jgi:hypothetical protein